MRSRPGRAFTGWWGRGPAHPRRPAGRVGLVLEVLEPRLLMVGSLTAPHGWVRGPAAGPVPPSHPAPGPVLAPVDPSGNAVDEAQGLGGLAPPTADTYVIIPETRAPHAGLPNAQRLPDMPYIGVTGLLGLGDTIDLYRVGVGPGSLALRLVSALDRPTAAPSLRLWVFDALGRVLASDSSPDASGSVDLLLDPRQSGLPEGSALFVGVAPAGPGEAGPGTGYQLWFLNGSDGSPTSDETDSGGSFTPSVAAGTPGVLLPNPSLASSSASSPGASGAVPLRAGAVPAGPALVISARFPVLSAAPSGGILADGPATRAIVAQGAPVGDPGWPEAQAPAAGPALEGGDRAALRLVALRGPGGFPLEGAASVGDWRGASHAEEELDGRGEADGAEGQPDVSPSAAQACTSTVPALAAGALLPAVNAPTPDQPGLEPALALTVYAVSVDRTSLYDLLDPRPVADDDPSRGRVRKDRGRRRSGRSRV